MNLNYKQVSLNINDLKFEAKYYDSNVDTVFVPLLRKLTQLQEKKNKRIIVFLAAPPGSGKSTLASFLSRLSTSIPNITEIQSIGIDGFHYNNKFLNSHFIDNNPQKNLLVNVKGMPETFDFIKLETYIKKIKETDIIWPTYSRISHDVSNDGVLVNRKIVLLEGNYLLLDKKPWNDLKDYADFSIFVNIDNRILKKNLISRKLSGGSSIEDAKKHYHQVDLKNIHTITRYVCKPDIMLDCDTHLYYSIAKGYHL